LCNNGREGIKVLFKLPLRQTTGMVVSLLRMANLDWPVPDYSTLCRRQMTLAVQMFGWAAQPAGPLSSLQAATVTAPSCLTCWTKYLKMSRSAP